MKNTTHLDGVVIEGGWRHRGSTKSLGLTLYDPTSGSPLAEIELDEKQVIQLLTGSHTGYVAGEFYLFHTGLSRIGKMHALIDVHVPYGKVAGSDALHEINAKLERAWELAGRFPWEPTIVKNWNGHHASSGIYRETMHGWFDASMTEESIMARFCDHDPVVFSNLRVFKERHPR